MEALNVVGLKTGSVYEDITIFLSDENFSDNTRKAYLRSIKEFFQYMNKGNIETLNHADLHYEEKDVIRYRNYLIKDKGVSNATANQAIAALQSLFSFFGRNKYETKFQVDTNVFGIKKLKNKGNSYGYLSPEEVDAMIKLSREQIKGIEKSLLIKMATRTSLRKETLLGLKWTDITRDEKNDCYTVNTIEEKTNTTRNLPISNMLYGELQELKTLVYYQKYTDGLIFHLSLTTISDMMANLCNELGIPEARNVVFHSFRSFAPNFIIEETGNFKASQQQLGHNSINTQWTSYVNKQIDVSQMAGILLDEHIEQDVYDKMTEDQMRNLLKETGTNSQKRQAMRIVAEG
jgi:site-specific recombinase XerD